MEQGKGIFGKARAAVRGLGTSVATSAVVEDLIDLLPNRSAKAARKQLTVLGVRPRHCKDCRSFNFEAGQQALGSHRLLGELTRVLSPDQMFSVHKTGREEDGRDRTPDSIREALPDGVSHQWADYGACTRHDQLVNKYYHCEDWA